MPHAKPHELPSGGGGRWPASGDGFRSVQWGDMEVGFTTTGPLDCTQLYQLGGFPGGVCTCPHYGYIFEGSIRATYPNTDWADEVACAGEVYFFPAGHILIYPEPYQGFGAESGVRFAAVHGCDSTGGGEGGPRVNSSHTGHWPSDMRLLSTFERQPLSLKGGQKAHRFAPGACVADGVTALTA